MANYYDNYDDQYEYHNNDEGEFLPDVDIFNRGSIEDKYSVENIAREAGIYPELRTKHKRFDCKIWRFYVYTNASAIHLKNNFNYLGLHWDDIAIILQRIKDFPNFRKTIMYKNPTAFVLGYLITKENNKINKTKLDMIIKDLSIIQNEKNIIIKPSDLIRYARLWLRLGNRR